MRDEARADLTYAYRPEIRMSVACAWSYVLLVSIELNGLTPAEAAVEQTLRGWCAELDTGR